MQEQSYEKHVRMHPLFHYVLVPLALVTFIGALFNLLPRFRGGIELWYAIILLVAAFAFVLVVMLERMYANKVQDRVVRLEENFRHFVLTGNTLDSRLNVSQIIALRFASDEEFVALAARAAAENLDGDAIKKQIKSWKPDDLRV